MQTDNVNCTIYNSFGVMQFQDTNSIQNAKDINDTVKRAVEKLQYLNEQDDSKVNILFVESDYDTYITTDCTKIYEKQMLEIELQQVIKNEMGQHVSDEDIYKIIYESEKQENIIAYMYKLTEIINNYDDGIFKYHNKYVLVA